MAEEKNIQSIDAFLAPNVEKVENEEVKLKRFKQPFVIKPLTQEEITAIQKANTKHVNFKGVMQESSNTTAITSAMVEEALVKPDLNNARLQASYGTPGRPSETLKKMLLAGEFVELAQHVQELSGFETEDLDSKADDLKN